MTVVSLCLLHLITEIVKAIPHPGRDDWIRTSDTYVPNVALYQAELHPENIHLQENIKLLRQSSFLVKKNNTRPRR